MDRFGGRLFSFNMEVSMMERKAKTEASISLEKQFVK